MGETACKFNLGRLMRKHKVTLRELAKRTGITLKAIRKVREMTRVDYCTYCDYTQAVTGINVCRGRYDAIAAQVVRSK